MGVASMGVTKLYRVTTFKEDIVYGFFFGKKKEVRFVSVEYLLSEDLQKYLDKEISSGYTLFEVKDIYTKP